MKRELGLMMLLQLEIVKSVVLRVLLFTGCLCIPLATARTSSKLT